MLNWVITECKQINVPNEQADRAQEEAKDHQFHFIVQESSERIRIRATRPVRQIPMHELEGEDRIDRYNH